MRDEEEEEERRKRKKMKRIGSIYLERGRKGSY